MSWYANRRRCSITICVGDYVWVRTDHVCMPQHLMRKLAPKFMGPYRVLRAINAVAFEVELPDTCLIHNVFHASQLKLYVAGSTS